MSKLLSKNNRPVSPKSVRFESLEPRVLMAADTAIAVTGSIDSPGETDQYGFTLTNDVKVVFDSLTNNSNLNWSLNGPNGNIVSGRSFQSSDSGQFGGTPALALSAGDYTLSVDAYRDATGTYSFRLLDLQTATDIAPGAVVEGDLVPSNGTNAYKFNASAGDQYYFDMKSVTGGGTVYWRLLDPNGTLVFGPNYMNGGDVGKQTLNVSGNYTLLIEGQYTNTVSTHYSFNVQPVVNDTSALSIEATTSGSIATVGQTDSYTFTLDQPSSLYFDSLTNSSNFNWNLVGPAGTVVSGRSFQSSDANGLGGSGLYDLLAGSYTLSVSAVGDATGSYAFRLMDRLGAQALSPDTPVTGQLNPAASTNMYKFNAIAGDRFYFDMREVTGGGVYWRLVDPFGQLVFGPNYMNGGDVDVTKLAFSGAYTLLIEGNIYNTGTTDYTFNVQKVKDDDIVELNVGQTQTGSIASAGQVDMYRFTLQNASQLYFDALSNNTAFVWSLLGPRGTVVNSRNFTASDSGNLSGTPALDVVAGDYTLMVDATGDQTGDYSFRLLDLQQATSLTPGVAVTGQLTPGNATDAYQLSVNPGDQFFFDQLSKSAGTVYWRLLDPYGRLVFGPNSFSDVTTQTLNYAGQYTLLVEGLLQDTSSTIDYSFNVDPRGNVPITPLPTGTPMLIGSTVSDALSVNDEKDNFSFTLTDNAQLFMDGLSTSSNFSWSLVGPRGTVVNNRSLYASDSAYFSASPLLDLVAGDYVLTLTGSAGNYSFRLLDKADATRIEPNTTVSGSLNPGASSNAYQFDVVAGDRFYFDVKSVSNTAYYRLLDPNGQMVFGPNYLSDVDVLTLSKTGSYTLLVEGPYYQSSPVSYSFSIQKVTDKTANLTVGETVSGRIATVGQKDIYTFSLDARKQLLMDSLSTNTSFNWSLMGPRGSVVSSRLFYASDSAYISGNATLDLVAGDYTLVVDAPSDYTGDYAFRLLDKALATPIELGTVIEGSLNPGQATQVYEFNANADERLYFDVQNLSNTAYCRLLGPNGQLVFGPDYMGDHDVFKLTQTGNYTLLVEGVYSITNAVNYSFKVQKVEDDLATLNVGEATTGSIAYAGQQDKYTFTLAESTELLMDSLSANTSLSWSLTGPRGVVVSSRALYASDSAYSSGSSLLKLSAGDYTLTIDAPSDITGDYSFRLLDKASATAIEFGVVVNGTLNPGQATNAYRFDAMAGDRFFFDIENVSNTAYYRLLDPNGQVVFGPSYLGDTDVITLNKTGSYTLLVEGVYYVSDAVNYSLNVLKVVDDAVVALSVGNAVSATISTAGQQDRYTFTLAAPAQLLMDSLTDNTSLNWSLVGPRGAVVSSRALYGSDSAYFGGSPLLDLVAGDYTLVVDGAGDTTGDLLSVCWIRPLRL